MLHPREDYQRIQDPAGLIPENEPVFLMRAQDKVAARTVRWWATVNVGAGGDPKLSQLAREHADKMDAWPVKKFADLPAEQPAEPAKKISAEHVSAEEAAEAEAERAATEQPAAEPESKPGSGVISGPAESESKPDAGVVSEPEKSQNKDGSGVV